MRKLVKKKNEFSASIYEKRIILVHNTSLLKASKDKNSPLQRQRRILSLKGNFDSIFNTCKLNEIFKLCSLASYLCHHPLLHGTIIIFKAGFI